jgi:hypothetical protein
MAGVVGGGKEKPCTSAPRSRSQCASHDPLKPVWPDSQTRLPAKQSLRTVGDVSEFNVGFYAAPYIQELGKGRSPSGVPSQSERDYSCFYHDTAAVSAEVPTVPTNLLEGIVLALDVVWGLAALRAVAVASSARISRRRLAGIGNGKAGPATRLIASTLRDFEPS